MFAIATAAAMLAQAPAPAAPAKSLVGTTRCDAAKAQALLKRTADTATLAEAIRLTGLYNVRVVWPGDRIEPDPAGDRLTVEVDRQNKIARLRCG